ncbi:hypothetical protein T492DRAFT_1023456 [Pavlovales sp. CCMP2436]|nr:hypothetical protein T492DRAFT_1023456 [Pavlovales sp. CCMP2436]
MAPKAAPSKSEKEAKAQKVADKTFGLKNKNKSKIVQQYIKATANIEQLTKDEKRNIKNKEEKEKEKIAEAARDSICKPVMIKQKEAPAGADPKSILCEFHKVGKCTKGAKCKFSHDLNIRGKAAKLDVFADKRDDIYKDQAALEKAILDREGGHGKRVSSEIICKHFIDAVERRQYGWIWKCPNGEEKCQYRHALPPGYKLKSEVEADKLLAMDEGPSLEDQIEQQRAELKVRTPLTFEVFVVWRERKKREAAEMEEQAMKDAHTARAKGGKVTLSGRALFQFDPTLFKDDAAAGADDDGMLAKYRKKQEAMEVDDDEEDEDDYGFHAAQPLYDLSAQNEEEPYPGAEEEEEEGEELEWFCDGCEGDILTTHRYDCPDCLEDEFCFCESCFCDEAKVHQHTLLKVLRSRAHASSERGRAEAAAALAGDGAGGSGEVDESLFEEEGDEDDDN